MKWNVGRETGANGEGPALARFQLHAHAVDIVVNLVDDVLVSFQVGCYQAKIVSIWESDDGGGLFITVKFVAILFLNVFQLKKHRIENHEEDGGAKGITLKNTTAESKGLRPP